MRGQTENEAREVDLENLDWQIRNLREEGRNRSLLNCWYVACALCTLFM